VHPGEKGSRGAVSKDRDLWGKTDKNQNLGEKQKRVGEYWTQTPRHSNQGHLLKLDRIDLGAPWKNKFLWSEKKKKAKPNQQKSSGKKKWDNAAKQCQTEKERELRKSFEKLTGSHPWSGDFINGKTWKKKKEAQENTTTGKLCSPSGQLLSDGEESKGRTTTGGRAKDRKGPGTGQKDTGEKTRGEASLGLKQDNVTWGKQSKGKDQAAGKMKKKNVIQDEAQCRGARGERHSSSSSGGGNWWCGGNKKALGG